MKNKLFTDKVFMTVLTGVIAFYLAAFYSAVTGAVRWDVYPVFVFTWFVLIFVTHAITNPKECEEYLNSGEDI